MVYVSGHGIIDDANVIFEPNRKLVDVNTANERKFVKLDHTLRLSMKSATTNTR